MKIATIDLGTNTFLLLISEFDEKGNLTVLRHEQRIPRIGKNVDKEGNIGKEAFEKSSDILCEYKEISKSINVDKIIATGTSALRDANNKIEFIDYINAKSGIKIEILPGEEEAKWSYRGAISTFPKFDGKCSVIDIGGGSTEVVLGKERNILNRKSLNIGCVRLTEKFFHHDPRLDEEIMDFKKFVKEALLKISNFDLSQTRFIGVAGTVTTLAAYHQNLDRVNIEKISGYKLTYNDILKLSDTLRKMRVEEINKISCIPKGRADVILAGTIILSEFMNYFKISEVNVSERGLRYGIAIREWENYNSSN